ncbi:MAG: hypothetical protein RLZZ292_3223 [Bacteroidota bacterium]|jgi:hypothetical protein
MESNQPNVSNEILAADFRTLLQGKISDAVIESTTNALLNQSQSSQHLATPKLEAAATDCPSYSASGSVVSLALYMKCDCDVNGGKSFEGKAWGLSIPGAGALFGDVYINCPSCSSINDLYSRTDNFVLTATSVYTAFYFYDKGDNYLGSFQSGAVSIVNGAGSGSGKWS